MSLDMLSLLAVRCLSGGTHSPEEEEMKKGEYKIEGIKEEKNERF